MNLAARLSEIWYAEVPAPWWLRCLVPLYRALRWIDRAPYQIGWRKPQQLPVPVIVVGNITVGGTGKTPLVIALIEALRARGRKPGVISRGYARSTSAPAVLDETSNAADCGDEPVLISAATRAPVAVGRNRIAAAERLLATNQCDVLIADDGLQHYPLLRNVEICVIDGQRRFGNGLLLPAGPLREPIERLDKVGFRVCNGGVAQSGEIPMQLVGDAALALNDPSQQKRLSEFAGQRVHAVAGIGNPQRFFAKLRDARIELIEHVFADHHRYVAADLAFGDDLPVLMTSKDAVKCQAFAASAHWQVPVRAELPSEFFDAVVARLG